MSSRGVGWNSDARGSLAPISSFNPQSPLGGCCLPILIAHGSYVIDDQSQPQPIGHSNTSETNDRKLTVIPDSGTTASPHDFNDLAPATVMPSIGGTRLPDLTIVKAMITLCLDLRHRFSWTPLPTTRTVTADSAVTASPSNSKHLAPSVTQALQPLHGHSPSGDIGLPDLAIVKAVITFCLDLRHRFAWTPVAIVSE